LLAYGGLIEVLQSFTPSRYAEFGDLFADGAGLALGAVLARLLALWMPQRQAR
jgi:VanZ family protein